MRDRAGVAGSLPTPEIYDRMATPDGQLPAGPSIGRLYACRCHVELILGTGPAPNIDPESIENRSTPWRCAGHERPPLPSDLEGHRIDPAAIEATLVAVLRDRDWPHPGLDPGFGGARILELLEPASRMAAARVLADLVPSHPDAVVRGRALRALQQRAREPEAAVVAELVFEPGALDLVDPDMPTRTVAWTAALALGARIQPDAAGTIPDPKALAALRALATRPPGIDLVLFNLVWADAPWVMGHLQELVAAGGSETWKTLLQASKSRPADARGVVSFILRTGAATKAEIQEFVARYLDGHAAEAAVGERFCAQAGLLVDARRWVGERYDAWWGPPSPAFGCGALRCAGCGEPVRHAPGAQLTGAPANAWSAGSGPGPIPGLIPDPAGLARAWFCRCDVMVVRSPGPASNPDPNSLTDFSTRWRCAGHPTVAVPFPSDAPLEDVLAHAVKAALADPAVPHPSFTIWPGFEAARVAAMLADDERQRWMRHLADLVAHDEDAVVRSRAIRALALLPHLAECSLLVELVMQHPERFADPDPAEPSRTSGWAAAGALAARTRPDANGAPSDAAAVEALKVLALQPPGLDWHLVNLAWVDGGWVADSAEALLRTSAGRGWDLLIQGVKSDPGRTERVVRAVLDGGWATPAEIERLA